MFNWVTWTIGVVSVLTITTVYYWIVRRSQQEPQNVQPQPATTEGQ